MGTYLCVPCTVGECGDCHGTVVRSQVRRACSCRHGAARTVARTADPRVAGGTLVAGVDGEVLLDTRNAVLLETATVARMDNPSDGRTVAALFLEGTLNRSTDRSAILYLTDAAGTASLVAELVGLAARMGPDFEAGFRAELDAHMNAADLWPAVVPAGRSDAS